MNWFFIAIAFMLFSVSPCRGASLTGMPGIAGLKLGTVPGSGYYFADTYFHYSSKDFIDRHGDKAKEFMGQPVSFEVGLDADFATFMWVSPYKVLGANYAANVTGGYGFAKGDLDLGETVSVSGGRYGAIDLSFQPVNLSWHLHRFDLSTAYGFTAPTGTFDKDEAVNTGRDRWTHTFQAGMTAYLDEKKSWSLAVAPRYDIYMGQQHKDARDGHHMALGWGIGKQWVFNDGDKKSPTGIFIAGPIGYALFQTTYNTGSAAVQKDVLPKVFSAGLEARYTRLNWKGATFSLRVQKEFEARGRPEGMPVTFNFSIKF